MERTSKTDATPGKFGKFLAIGMAVALIWGFLLLIVGLFLRLKFGTVLSDIMGDPDEVVKTKSALSPSGQTIMPLSTSVDDEVDFGGWSRFLGSMVIMVGLVTILFAALGIYGGLKHSKFVLYMTIVFLLIAMMFMLGLITVAADSGSTFHADAKDEMISILRARYQIEKSDDSFITTLNRIMIWFECCGVRSYEEFKNLTFKEINADMHADIVFKVPPACCVREFFNAEASGITPYQKLKECATRGADVRRNIHTTGCYNAVFDTFTTPATVVLLLILIWDILVLLLVILTIMETRPEEEMRESIQEAKKEELEEAPPMKKFVPFAKISSFVHPDLSRIKSTEIW